jgi:hypothetical protein
VEMVAGSMGLLKTAVIFSLMGTEIAPVAGVVELTVTGSKFTVNGCEPLVMPELVTVTFCAPIVVPAPMVNVAVIDVVLTTAVLLTVMPVPLKPIVDPDPKDVPVSVTGTVCPCMPEFALTEVSVGAVVTVVTGVDDPHPAVKTTSRSAVPRAREQILLTQYFDFFEFFTFMFTDMLFLHSLVDILCRCQFLQVSRVPGVTSTAKINSLGTSISHPGCNWMRTAATDSAMLPQGIGTWH